MLYFLLRAACAAELDLIVRMFVQFCVLRTIHLLAGDSGTGRTIKLDTLHRV